MGRNDLTTGTPTTATAANTIATEILASSKTIFTAIINHEHICAGSGTPAANGEHRVGAVGCVYKGATADIQSITYAIDSDSLHVLGALCYDTDKECLVLCTTVGNATTAVWSPCTPRIVLNKSFTTDQTGIVTETWTNITNLPATADKNVANLIPGEIMVIQGKVTLATYSTGALYVSVRLQIDGVTTDVPCNTEGGGTVPFFWVYTVPAATTDVDITTDIWQNSGSNGTAYDGRILVTVYPVM